MKTLNLSIEEIGNGYIVNGYAYGNGDDTIIGPCGKSTKSYAKDYDEVGEMVAEFIVDNA